MMAMSNGLFVKLLEDSKRNRLEFQKLLSASFQGLLIKEHKLGFVICFSNSSDILKNPSRLFEVIAKGRGDVFRPVTALTVHDVLRLIDRDELCSRLVTQFGKVLNITPLNATEGKHENIALRSWRVTLDEPEIPDSDTFTRNGYPNSMSVRFPNYFCNFKVSFHCLRCKKNGHIQKYCKEACVYPNVTISNNSASASSVKSAEFRRSFSANEAGPESTSHQNINHKGKNLTKKEADPKYDVSLPNSYICPSVSGLCHENKSNESAKHNDRKLVKEENSEAKYIAHSQAHFSENDTKIAQEETGFDKQGYSMKKFVKKDKDKKRVFHPIASSSSYATGQSLIRLGGNKRKESNEKPEMEETYKNYTSQLGKSVSSHDTDQEGIKKRRCDKKSPIKATSNYLSELSYTASNFGSSKHDSSGSNKRITSSNSRFYVGSNSPPRALETNSLKNDEIDNRSKIAEIHLGYKKRKIIDECTQSTSGNKNFKSQFQRTDFDNIDDRSCENGSASVPSKTSDRKDISSSNSDSSSDAYESLPTLRVLTASSNAFVKKKPTDIDCTSSSKGPPRFPVMHSTEEVTTSATFMEPTARDTNSLQRSLIEKYIAEAGGVLPADDLKAFLAHSKKKSNLGHILVYYGTNSVSLLHQIQAIVNLYYRNPDQGTKEDKAFIKKLQDLSKKLSKNRDSEENRKVKREVKSECGDATFA